MLAYSQDWETNFITKSVISISKTSIWTKKIENPLSQLLIPYDY